MRTLNCRSCVSTKMFVSPFCYVEINEPIPNLILFQLSYVCHALWWHTFALQVLFRIMNPEQALAKTRWWFARLSNAGRLIIHCGGGFLLITLSAGAESWFASLKYNPESQVITKRIVSETSLIYICVDKQFREEIFGLMMAMMKRSKIHHPPRGEII